MNKQICQTIINEETGEICGHLKSNHLVNSKTKKRAECYFDGTNETCPCKKFKTQKTPIPAKPNVQYELKDGKVVEKSKSKVCENCMVLHSPQNCPEKSKGCGRIFTMNHKCGRDFDTINHLVCKSCGDCKPKNYSQQEVALPVRDKELVEEKVTLADTPEDKSLDTINLENSQSTSGDTLSDKILYGNTLNVVEVKEFIKKLNEWIVLRKKEQINDMKSQILYSDIQLIIKKHAGGKLVE